MSKSKSDEILKELFAVLVPESMSSKDRKALAREAGISYETLRTTMKRQTLNANTLVRLMLARGISSHSILELPQTELARLSKGEIEWQKIGRKLTETEKNEFASLIEFIRSKWNIAK